MKSGWVTKKLGEVCESISSRDCQIQQNEICEVGKFPVVSQSEVFIEGYSDFENTIETVPVVLFGDHTCCVKYIDFPFVVGADGTKLLTSKQIDVKFLYYAILKISFSLVDGKYRRHFKDLKKCDISIPPLSEQNRIVKKIDAAFEKIDALKANAEKNLANAKELFQSALDEAMRPKKGWVEKMLGEVCDGKMSYGTSAPSCAYDTQVRYIRITDIDDDGRLLDDLVSPREYEQKHILKEGDVVFARTGATVGKSYMYSLSDGKCVYAGYLIRARVKQDVLNPKFLFYFTKTSAYKLFIQTSQAAAAQPNVNAHKYGNLKVPIPPLHEQSQIVSRIEKVHDAVRMLKQNYNKQIADCAEMKQSILHEAFEGRL